MNPNIAAQSRPEILGKRVVRGVKPADLVRVYEPGVLLVTVPTSPRPEALIHAAALAERGPRSTTTEVPTSEGVVQPGCVGRLAVNSHPRAHAWIAYVEELVSMYAALVGADVVGVRQLVADRPHCPRFHVDRVPARAVLNVLGPCTEWLHDEDVDRSRLGHAGGRDDRTSGLVRRWDRLERARLGELAIFKGTAWPGAEQCAIVHRSPPADGRRRVLLTLDSL